MDETCSRYPPSPIAGPSGRCPRVTRRREKVPEGDREKKDALPPSLSLGQGMTGRVEALTRLSVTGSWHDFFYFLSCSGTDPNIQVDDMASFLTWSLGSVPEGDRKERKSVREGLKREKRCLTSLAIARSGHDREGRSFKSPVCDRLMA